MDTEIQITCPCLCAGRVKMLEERLEELETKLEHARLYGFSISAEDE